MQTQAGLGVHLGRFKIHGRDVAVMASDAAFVRQAQFRSLSTIFFQNDGLACGCPAAVGFGGT